MISSVTQFFAKVRYTPVSDESVFTEEHASDDEEAHPSKYYADDPPAFSNESLPPKPGSRRTGPSFFVVSNVLLFILSLWLFTLSTITSKLDGEGPLERNHFLKKTSMPSPLLDALDIPMMDIPINGTLMEQRPVSIFRQRPSPEVDAAWARIETQAPIPISRQDILDQGKDPDMSAKFPESFGFGLEAYIGRIDVFHQIHCLNRLRMHLKDNWGYYYGGQTGVNHEYHRLHVDHCVYILLQNLMCTSNVDVYPHTWLDAQENAFPDFSIKHKCRDFNAILKFHDDNSVPLEKFGALRKPPAFKAHVMNHEFKKVFQWYTTHPDDGDLGKEIF